MKRKTLFIVALTLSLATFAQKDITSMYLQNPSFEQDDITKLAKDNTRGAYTAPTIVGWTLSGAYGVSDIMTAAATATDNNFGVPGKPADGTQMYYLRHAWAAATPSLTQEASLPAGKYRLSVDNKCITLSNQSAQLVAGEESTAFSFATSMPSAWTTTSVDFTLTKQTTVSLGIKANFINDSGGSIIVDNFRLYDISDMEEEKDPTEADVKSPTEGIITQDFVAEDAMKKGLLQMLADFSKYLVDDFQECQAPNSIGEACGAFKGENTMGNNEQGVRPNADLSMICAFLVKYGKPAGVTLPSGVTWSKIEDMARKSLVFAYSTHKANKLKVCSGNNYWGSTSTSDVAWESSLWAMSVAYSAYFQWNDLTEAQRTYIYNMLKAECNYELNRGIPTGYNGDTKAEENGWEADILAATLGLFPNDPLAPKWFARMREFAINSYSHPSDAENNTVIDPDYDKTTIADLYKGQNLYDDYTLQNHNLFHTSYQNVVMQELGEAALALKMFQLGIHGKEIWKSNALMHHNQEVMDSVLNWLALADGELAMPNGNDWSLFLYDQITSYTTQACFQRDTNALMLENLAYKYIQARQKTTTDGSWLLRADVGARRMGVEAHRVMMTYLMHDVLSTADLTPTNWEDFRNAYADAKILPCQNVVRAMSKDRFTTFSWSNGLKSYTGYFAANNPDKNKIVVPFRANNTGNFLGWYEVSGKSTDATPVVNGVYKLMGNSYVMNGELNTNGSTLNNRFALYSTPGNAIIYLDYVTANSAATITAEKGGMLAISVDDMTKTKRTLYYSNGNPAYAANDPEYEDLEVKYKQLDGTAFTQLSSDWVNIDNEVGVVSVGSQKKIAFGERANNNSIMTAKLYPMYSNTSRNVVAGSVVDARNTIYYSNTNAKDTKVLAYKAIPLREQCENGWNGVMAIDPDGTHNLLLANFKGSANTMTLKDIQTKDGMAPVFVEPTTINNSKSTATFNAIQNSAVAEHITVYLEGSDVIAQQDSTGSAYVIATKSTTINAIVKSDKASGTKKDIKLNKDDTIRIYLNENGEVCVENASFPSVETGEDLTSKIVNPSFDGNVSTGWNGTKPAFQTYTNAEYFNSTGFDIYQVIKGLEPGLYEVGVQAFYRAGGIDVAVKSHNNGTEALNAKLYANDSTVSIMSIYDEANSNYKIGVNTAAGFTPDNMEQAASYFRKGLYKNTVTALVGEDGELKIGITKNSRITSDWVCFDNFTLRYLGQKEDPEATAVNGILSSKSQSPIYTLQGARVADHVNMSLPRGIYVIDGQKVMVR